MNLSFGSITRSIVNLAPDAYDLQRKFDDLNASIDRYLIKKRDDDYLDLQTRFAALTDDRKQLIEKMKMLLENLSSPEWDNLEELF